MSLRQPTTSVDTLYAPANMTGTDAQPLHRIALVRHQQGISLRTAARHMGRHASELRDQEQSTTDLRLSELYAWQQALDVPISDLLMESDGSLARPVLQRAQMLRLMKTAMAIVQQADSAATRRMGENLVNQLLEIMPELKEIGPWHSVGQRRSHDEYGAAYYRRLTDEPTLDPSSE